MSAYVNGEVLIFLWSIVSGIIIMLAYDFFSVFTGKENLSILICNIFDGIFVVTATALMIFILLNISNGYIRSFEFIGAAIGGLLYKFTLSRFFKTLFSKIIYAFFAIFDFFCKILLTPIKFMYKIMYNSTSVLKKAVFWCLSPLKRSLSLVKISLKKT